MTLRDRNVSPWLQLSPQNVKLLRSKDSHCLLVVVVCLF